MGIQTMAALFSTLYGVQSSDLPRTNLVFPRCFFPLTLWAYLPLEGDPCSGLLPECNTAGFLFFSTLQLIGTLTSTPPFVDPGIVLSQSEEPSP